jgi:hypothetical protein
MKEHEKQTKADWDDAHAAWRCENRRRPQAKGNATRSNHRATGTAGCGQAAGFMRGEGSLPSRLDHRQDQEVAPVISWQNSVIERPVGFGGC